VDGLKSIDRLRRRRNQAEYPDPQNYDPVTPAEVHDAIAAAHAALDAAGKLIGVPQLGISRGFAAPDRCGNAAWPTPCHSYWHDSGTTADRSATEIPI